MADEQNEENLEAQRRQGEALRDLTQAFEQAGREMAAHGRVSEVTNRKIRDAYEKAAKAGLNLEDALNRASTAAGGWMRVVGGALEDLAQAAIGTATTLQRGNKGLTAYDSQIQQLSGAVKGVLAPLQAMGPITAGFGKALGIAGDAATTLALAATHMGDTLYTSFGALNRAGGAAADGMTGLFEDAKNLGLGMNELSALTDAVAGRAQDFALFGGSVFDARKRLGQMGDQLRDNREQFLSLGMTMPEVTEGLANYVALQGRLGRGQTQTTAQLAESARKYLIEQDAVTKALGLTRQQQEEAQQRAMANEQFMAKVNMLRASGDEAAADRLMALARRAAAIGPEFEEGVHSLVSGNLANEKAAKLLQSSMGAAAVNIDGLIAGTKNVDQAFGGIVGGVHTFRDNVGNMAGLVNANNANFLALNEQQKASIIAQHGYEEGMKRINEEQRKMGAEGAKAQDPVLAAQAKLMNTQILANESLDRLVFKVLPPVQFGMQKLTDGALAAARALNKLSDEDPKSDTDQKVIEENTRALESMQEELGEAEAAYEKAMEGASVLQKMGIGRTDEQQAAFDRQKELRARESALERGIATAESGTRGMDTAGGMGMPGEAPVPEAAPERGTKSAAAAPQVAGPQRFSEEDLYRRGLRIKPGATQREGGVIQANAVDLAEQVQKQISGFSRITGFDDGHMRSETSKHQQGRAFDFTVEGHPSRDEGARIVGQLKGMGASTAIDEYNNKTRYSSGPHFHVEVPAMAQGGITSGVSIAGEAGPEAVVPLPNGKSIPVDLSGLGPISVDMSGLGPISVDMSGQGMDKMHSSSAMLQQAADSLNALGVGSGRDLDQSLKDAMAHLREILLEAPQTTDIAKSLADLDSSMTEWNRVSGVTGGNFAFAQEKLLPDMLASAQGSAVDTDFYKNIEAQIKTPSGTQLGTIDDLRQLLSEQSTNNVDSLRETQSEFRSALGQIVQEIRQTQQSNLQQEILQTLQSINRSQGRTADASQRMADVAMN
jgi:hypothetical protein